MSSLLFNDFFDDNSTFFDLSSQFSLLSPLFGSSNGLRVLDNM